MTEPNNGPFCPLYAEAIKAKPWKNAGTANRGLVFDKFASAWRKNGGNLEFDKGTGNKKDGAGKWLQKMAGSVDSPVLAETCTRQRRLVEAFGGKVICLKNTSRFVTGMGREHPLENGFAWHHTLGVPYLPGSSLKGLLRAWDREENGTWTGKKWAEQDTTGLLFGSQGAVGRFILLDMLPTSPPKLAVDIMTPHYGPYYQDTSGKTHPGDWHSPVPISFLVVEERATWQVAILPGPAKRTVTQAEFDQLAKMLVEAFTWFGAGAKTAVGYGRFERDHAAEKQIQEEKEQRRKEEAKQKANNAELQGLPLEVAQLVKLARSQSWTGDKFNNTPFLNGIDRYLEENPSPSEACIDWIQEHCIEFFWKGIWDNPDAMKGKKKDKPKYKSKRARKLVHRLKGLK